MKTTKEIKQTDLLSKKNDTTKELKEIITHFETFLDKYNIRVQFLDNLFSRGSYHSLEELFKDNIKLLRLKPSIIFNAHTFIWNDTPEGFDFWEGIRNKWVDYVENLLN